ncbi:PEP-CTERM sorting domain-containing protein [Sphingomonas elodea]|uniref:PEP-CTERM sorting domain-containing protein n=1 Tax=Sphingomonas elodea TaxID=179878 RepID=UPI00049565B6|nr:PEP-CTERM sorting domain-containing protein [Sphingomonas elodea]
MTRALSILAGTMLLLSAPAAAQTLSAGYAGGNGNDGILFDLSSTSSFRLHAFDINAQFGTFDYRIYYHAGGVAGALADPAAWTLIDSFNALTTAGEGAPTLLDIADLALSGGTHGFYITDGGAFSIRYTNSLLPSGAPQQTSGPLTLRVGYGADAFGGVTPDRAFNGAITFTAVPEPAAWGVLTLGFGAAGGALRRRRATGAHSIA